MSSAIELPVVPVPMPAVALALDGRPAKMAASPKQTTGPNVSSPDLPSRLARWYGHAAAMSIYK